MASRQLYWIHREGVVRGQRQEPLRSAPQNETIDKRIAALRWKYAKTYPDAPHEYILQQWDPEVFAYFEEKLRTEAIREQFTLRGKTYWYRYYYRGDGYRYWIIDYVLNRCQVADIQRFGVPDTLNSD
jgi:hypothetical protein